MVTPLSLVKIQSRGATVHRWFGRVPYVLYYICTDKVPPVENGDPSGLPTPHTPTIRMAFKRAINGSILEFEHRRSGDHQYSQGLEDGEYCIGGIYWWWVLRDTILRPQLGLGNVQCTPLRRSKYPSDEINVRRIICAWHQPRGSSVVFHKRSLSQSVNQIGLAWSGSMYELWGSGSTYGIVWLAGLLRWPRSFCFIWNRAA